MVSVVLFHGGYNSLHSALWHGLPMVVTPLGAGDQYPTGLLCEKLRLGIMVNEQPPEPGVIRAALKIVIEQPTYRTRAQQLQHELKNFQILARPCDDWRFLLARTSRNCLDFPRR